MVGGLPIRIVKSKVSSIGPSSEKNREKGPTLETLDFSLCIGSTPIFLYFDFYLYSAYAAVSTLHLY